ncbi:MULTISPECIES: Eco57I restriction-modification methylase domain-containing protein [unclassified Gemella]|uniref:Eco57I restriction-modification methylase domain-containing protein n=1 Tax=unclassified Gemella TaxID=2624949 RepID=UPI001C04FA74|nr:MULTISPECIES: Eco57I restriction-modification methylase domain-containing protein [unclassified Gemella]MBU0279140.1 Eco57I restriction-modification methylase domain-containing protein [Gemella sp. zg-1178]QWQ38617.1 Eco57I restriction-modification methylase domain-containing protein [Gemella sp. zg-570]
MRDNKIEAIDILDRIIVGRVDPYIYAFTTNTIPNYLKVGDTYRSVAKRLNEWRVFFPELEKQYESKALIDDETYFRDYSVHKYLEDDLKKIRLLPSDLENDLYYSKEFFKGATPEDVENAINDIKNNHIENTGKYEYYSSKNNLPQTFHYQRGDNWNLRPNQLEAVNNFDKAIKNGRKNLLMYAVMRFGKSFTSLCCALKMDAELVLVLSAKADVRDEWKKTVESAGNFHQYIFLDAEDLLRNEEIIKDKKSEDKRIVLFLTLQDLQGETIKDKHKQLFEEQIDLLIVDETHFGARAESFGKILKDAGYDKNDEKNFKKISDDSMDVLDAKEEIKKINASIRLHLSGTPYRILMGSEFEKEDIISFVQFSDIVKEQEEWDKNNLNNDDVNEWDNPYYGFPQMIRFAFNPNKSSRQKMEALRRSGVSFAFSKLFEPVSIKKDSKNNNHKKFQNESEIIDLLKVIDGSKDDEDLLGFLDYDKIKEGKMCRHMVMVLPYCASCDAMEELITTHKDSFRNLNDYQILNISGVDSSKTFRTPNDIKNKIKEYETENKKTLTLTVNRMLTGSTVEQWDTMMYFKDTASPQEYDQSIFRLQNQYIRILSSESGIIKENLKPQTLLVDFDPDRLFRMQEQKSLIYNVNTDENGNSKLRERIEEELRISPVIVMNNNKIKQVDATNILEAVSLYNNKRSVSDEVVDIPIDLSILEDDEVRKAIEEQGEFNSKQGLTIDPNQGEGDDLDIDDSSDDSSDTNSNKDKDNKSFKEEKTDEEIKRLEGQIKTYYQRVLFFSFLTKDNVASLDDILNVIQKDENTRLAKNLYLNKNVLEKLSYLMDPFKRSKLDYKIQNISKLASDDSVSPLDRALTSLKKFNRMSESEVITPTRVCNEMVDLIPEGGLRKIVNEKNKLLDIATKSGEYAVALYKRLINDLGFSHEEVKDIIYSIPTSSIAYEFTRRFYEILDLDIDNIAINFNAYDLVKSTSDNVDYEKICNLLKQNKKFREIDLTDEIKAGEKIVKFGAIVGNPPYQVSDGGAQSSAKPIYHHFVLLGKQLSNTYTSFITPTRWFAGGKGLDNFREYMLNDNSIVELHDFLTPEDVFPNTNNRGGVCYFISDINKVKPEVKVVTNKNREVISNIDRKLLVEGIEIFIRDSIGLEIIDKCKGNSISEEVSSLRPFGFRGYFITDPKYKDSLEDMINPIICYGKGKKIGFVERELVGKNTEWIDSWKVFIPRANNIGTELNDDNLNAFVAKPNEICTESYLSIGANLNLDNKSSCNLVKYLTTKFVRYMHSLAKASQDATSKTFRFVPIQDFSDKSDIDWSKSIEEIDIQLFEKYSLTENERNHIKTSIKEM